MCIYWLILWVMRILQWLRAHWTLSLPAGGGLAVMRWLWTYWQDGVDNEVLDKLGLGGMPLAMKGGGTLLIPGMTLDDLHQQLPKRKVKTIQASLYRLRKLNKVEGSIAGRWKLTDSRR